MENEPTICLNMIVKNESKIITRLFDSVLSIIDCYMICDTGSTDDTKEIIKSYFESKHIPGKIINEPFKNFAHNRNVALQNCIYMSDYILLLDADMVLDVRSFKKTDLVHDCYFVLQGSDAFHYNNVRIVRNNGLFKYNGVTHEYVDTPPNTGIHTLDKTKIFINDIGDGGSKTNKYERDIELLTKGIEEEPQNRERYYFYLANSYFDLRKYDQAIENYKIRITLKGFDQEIWYSYYRIGFCYKEQGQIEKAIYTWLEGYNFFPLRIENLYEIVSHYRIIGKQILSMFYYDMAKNTQKKIKDKDSYLFLYNDVYTYKLEYEYSIIACYLGITNINSQVVTIFNNCNDMIIINNLLSNMKFYKDILKPDKIIKLTETIEHCIGGKTREFHSSSSCIIPVSKNGKNILPSTHYLMNIRYVNYKITPGGSYVGSEDYIMTINKYVEMTKDFQIIKEKLIDSHFDSRMYIGIEDVRLYYNKNNNLILTGTGLNQNNNLCMVIGDYNYEDIYLKNNEIKSSFTNNDCEKNWVFTTITEKKSNGSNGSNGSNDYNEIKEDYIIYKWFPLFLCKMNENKTEIDVEIVKNMPQIFQHARGSTNASFYNNEIWFVVHYVSYECPRHYYHMIVVFDNSMNLKRYSAPFKFEGEPIEYCIGLIVEEERVLITYSCWDHSTNIAVYDKKYIEEKLVEKIF